VVVLATWSRKPLLHARDLRPGHHLTTLGADEPGKAELSADLLTASRVVVDDRDLAAAGGALGTAGLPATAAVTLGEILRGDRPANENTDQPTVYAPVGLPWQDLALTWLVYRAAVAAGRVPTIDLLNLTPAHRRHSWATASATRCGCCRGAVMTPLSGAHTPAGDPGSRLRSQGSSDRSGDTRRPDQAARPDRRPSRARPSAASTRRAVDSDTCTRPSREPRCASLRWGRSLSPQASNSR
jgi:hypothetical protein